MHMKCIRVLLEPAHTGRNGRPHLAINVFEPRLGAALSAEPMAALLADGNVHIILPIRYSP